MQQIITAKFTKKILVCNVKISLQEILQLCTNNCTMHPISISITLSSFPRSIKIQIFQDTTVEPRETSHFEFYAPGDDTTIIPLRESPLYLEDWIGLKTLDEEGRLHLLEIPGDHLSVSTDWLISEIIQKYFV